MSVPLTLLGLLERGPSHGYDLKRDYDAYFGRGRPLGYSQVYAMLSPAGRPRDLPTGGRPAMDRSHRGPAGPARPGGAPVTAGFPAAAAQGIAAYADREVVVRDGKVGTLTEAQP